METPIINGIMNHRSVRRFDPDYTISKKDIEIIIKAGQQASTSCSGQMYTIIELPKGKRNLCGKQKFIADASFFGIICVDVFRLHKIVEKTGGKNPKWPLASLTVGIFDAGLFGQNLALAAEELGYGVCFAGTCGDMAEQIIEGCELPEMVLPLTGIAIGKSTEEPPVRPRLPSELIHHKERYHKYTQEEIERGIKHMSDRLDEEGYYRKYTGRDNFLWKDHVKRKFGGAWLEDVELKRNETLRKQRFLI